MQKFKRYLPWIAAGVMFIAILLVIWLVDFDGLDKSGKVFDRFPEDAIEASLKLGDAGYSVTIEDNVLMLGTMATDASNMYGIAFSGSITSYLLVTDPESGESQAEIFYFEYAADANLLYGAMAENWQFEKEEGELRCQDKTVYMGYGEVLDVLDG